MNISTVNPASNFFRKIGDLEAFAALEVRNLNLCNKSKDGYTIEQSINKTLDRYMPRISIPKAANEKYRSEIIEKIVHLCNLDKQDGDYRLGRLADKVTDGMRERWTPKGGLRRKTRKTKKSKKNTRRF
jgi:hypothetical protein